MNVELLQKVKERILAEPERFDMADWCGTTACIAGWACSIKRDQDPASIVFGYAHPEVEGMEALEIPRELASSLFYVANWPEEFVYKYYDADTNEQRALIAADRIDHFIEHGA